jgi:hypothetical protein
MELTDSANRRLAAALWIGSVVTFAAGMWLGLAVNAYVGAWLWVLSAVFGFLPFLSARTRHSGKWSR